MGGRDLLAPTVPVSYLLLMLDVAATFGVGRARLLDGLGLSDEILQNPDSRVLLLKEYAEVCRRALKMSGEGALAYEFGLRASLTSHGLLGYGLMSQQSLRDVFAFADRFGSVLRLPAWRLLFSVQDRYVQMEAIELVSHGNLRRFSCEQLLVTVSSIVQHLLPIQRQEIELCFEHDEPAYHARYRARLPTCRFLTGKTRLRVPIKYLNVPLTTADPISARLAERECEREAQAIDTSGDIVHRVNYLISAGPDGYPSASHVARSLSMCPRTLARHLCARNTSFRDLLAHARQRDCLALLDDKQLTTEDIAIRLGYSSKPNFCRAFKKWYGTSPEAFRKQRRRI